MNKPVDDIGAAQERFAELGGAMSRMAEQPELLAELDRTFAAGDVRGFRRALDRDGFGPPPEKCSPYVTTYIRILRPPKLVKKCRWVPRVLTDDDITAMKAELRPGIDISRLTEVFKQLGLIVCQWEWENQDDVIAVERFVRGICPPGTF